MAELAKAGDRVVVEAAPPRRLIVTKEGNTMTSTARLELEIDLLDKKRAAIDSDLVYKQEQHNKDTPCEPEMTDSDLIGLVFTSTPGTVTASKSKSLRSG